MSITARAARLGHVGTIAGAFRRHGRAGARLPRQSNIEWWSDHLLL